MSPAYWNATRAFMILSGIACFAGVMAGILSFTHFSAFERFSRSFAASILFFISSKSHAGNFSVCFLLNCIFFYISFNCIKFSLCFFSIYSSVYLFSYICTACYGNLHWCNPKLPGQALWRLALFLVLHTGLGGHAYDILCR